MLSVYAGLFASAFLAATILPVSSEIPLGFLVNSNRQFLLPLAVATVGNFLGSCTTWWLGRRAARLFASPESPANARTQRATAMLRRFGPPILLLSWIPILGDALVAVAGMIGVRFAAFSVWTFLGKLARYTAFIWITLKATA
jgi:membrane protein YqaA with SNARE-associated domain